MMPNPGKDVSKEADRLKDLLSQIETEETGQSEEDTLSQTVHAGTDEEILPEGIDIEKGHRIDEYCILSTDDKYIHAVLTILPNRPEDYQIPVPKIAEAMKRIGIRFGVRKDNMEKAVQVARASLNTRLDLIIAQGKRSVDGTDSALTFHWTVGPRKPLVRKGDLLVEKEPGRLSKDGRNILGRILQAHRGEEVSVIPKEGVVCSEDGLSVYAARDGIVRWDDGRIWVEPEDRDGYITIETSSDLLSATISIYPPSGKGKHLDVAEIIPKLFNAGITYGIQRQVIANAVKQVRETGEPELFVRVAKGRPAEKGKDGRLDMLADVKSKTDRYWINADGTVNFYKLSRIDSVQEGEVLANITPPICGREGCTVTGEKIPGIEGKAAKVRMGENVILSDDETQVSAAISGQVHLEDNVLCVRPIYVVNGDVDFSTGNLEFIGDLTVRGNVQDGFELQVGGNITIEGTVGSCSITAGGNVNVGRGVFGRERGMIRARGDVTVAFLQNATVYAGGNILLANQILNSRVFAKEKILATTGKGSIVGGRVQAGKGIEAKVIGSDFGTRTEVLSGIDWEVEENLKTLRNQIERHQENLAKLDAMIHQFLQTVQLQIDDLPAEERQLIHTAITKRKVIEEELHRTENEQRNVRTQILLPLPADIVATYMLHVDVRCCIWDAKLRVRKPEKCARVSYDKETERLVMSSYIP
ncbi:MAG: FapA family protein [bacterium]